MMLRLGLLAILTLNVAAHVHTSSHNHLLVLLLDGFKWDYLDLIPDSLGGFSEFLKHGVRAEHVNGIYPTNSYPSWTSLSTGLFAESHGILGNYFYNREKNELFELNKPNKELFWWQKAEPIWTTASKHGLKVATILWSRSDVPFAGILPESPQGYQQESNWTAIENTLKKSLEYLQHGYHLVMAYGEHIDNVGHRSGPKSPELKQALIDVGQVLERFFDQLTRTGLRDKVNVLLVSDHGMTDGSSTGGTRYHQLESLISLTDIEYVMDHGAIAKIYAEPDRVEAVFNTVVKTPGIKAYLNHEIPEKYHFKNNENVPDILLVAEKGHLIVGASSSKQIPPAWNQTLVQGVHGYDPILVSDMRTVFMATGPDVQRGILRPAIDLVDIYQVYCHLLGIKPQPHNGTWSKVQHFFAEHAHSAATTAAGAHIITILGACVFTLTYSKTNNL